MWSNSFWPACLLRNAFCLLQTPTCCIVFKKARLNLPFFFLCGDSLQTLPLVRRHLPATVKMFKFLRAGWDTVAVEETKKGCPSDLCVLLFQGSRGWLFFLRIYDYVSRYLVKLVYHTIILLPLQHFPCPSWFRVFLQQTDSMACLHHFGNLSVPRFL